MRLDGEVAVITGATRGIGRRMGEMFAEAGAKVVLAGRNREQGEAAAQAIGSAGGEAIFVRTDMTQEPDVENLMTAAADRFGPVTVLVNNAAPVDEVSGASKVDDAVVDLSTDNFRYVTDVVLSGTFWACKYAIPQMRTAGHGSIVNISSGASIQGIGGMSAYSAAKGAVNSLTRAIAVDYGKDNIRCNTIVCGFVVSNDTTAGLIAHPGFRAAVENIHITPRVGTCEDLGHAAIFLASDLAGFISGNQLAVDGGLSAKMGLVSPDVVNMDMAPNAG